MTNQRALLLSLRRSNGDSKAAFQHLQSVFNRHELPFETGHTPPEKLLADLLKRQATQVMRDITECPPDTLPANVCRLDCVLETLKFAVRHGLVEPAECRISGAQLCYPATCEDFSEALAVTRRQHRAPALQGLPDAQLDRIENKLETLAAFIGGCL